MAQLNPLWVSSCVIFTGDVLIIKLTKHEQMSSLGLAVAVTLRTICHITYQLSKLDNRLA